MKIRRIQILSFMRRLDGKAWNPAFRWTERRAPLVIIEDNDGVFGMGEAWAGYTGSEEVQNILIREVAPRLTGCEFRSHHDIENVLQQCRPDALNRCQAAAWSAIDIAMWDWFGRKQGLPVWKLLGGASAMTPVYASGGLYRDGYTPRDLYEEAVGYCQRGFRAMKMKIGGVAPETDVQRIAAVRQGLGNDVVLWVDAVNRLTVDTTIALRETLKKYDVSAVQSPVVTDDVEGMRRLKQSGIFVVAAEAEYRNTEFLRLIASNAVSCLQFCLPLCGGFSGARHLAVQAGLYGIKNTPQCFSTAVAQAATLHFSASCKNTLFAEYHCFHDHLHELFEGDAGFVRDGLAVAGNLPGLGIRRPEPGRQNDGSVISLVADAH